MNRHLHDQAGIIDDVIWLTKHLNRHVVVLQPFLLQNDIVSLELLS